MSKAEILKELPALLPAERREIFDRLCDLQERDLLASQPPTPEEKALLERELEDYRKNPEAGSSWEDVEARLRGPSPITIEHAKTRTDIPKFSYEYSAA